MSDMREKLIEIICDGTLKTEICTTDTHIECETCKGDCGYCTILADHLISNGVRLETKQATETSEWIPAKEPPKESGEYLVVIHKAAQATTLLYSAEEKSWYEVTVNYATNPDGEEIYTYYAVDWWMPLPEPPKGE